jgi:16S rRNA G966 N2-methylase RsmD
MWSRLKALPPYLGGKRKLLGQIFKHLPPPHAAPVFIDAFLGGGSVSLMAKARGYRVVSNDIALRSFIVGKALIANSRVRLEHSDLVRLFAKPNTTTDFIKVNFSPGVLTTSNAEFLDLAFSHVDEFNGTKQWLIQLLLIKYIIGLRPVGNFGARTIIRQVEDRQWEDINPHFLRNASIGNICLHPLQVIEQIRRSINSGIFDNGYDNRASQRDVFEFLNQIEGGDIIYLDPPYAGTKTYEGSLKELDSILAGKIIKPQISAFSGKKALEFIERLFAACQRFPVWTISYGNAEINLDDLTTLVRKFKKEIISEEFSYTHLPSLSGEKLRKRDKEYLIIAR